MSTPPLAAADLAEIEARAEAATPGPWKSVPITAWDAPTVAADLVGPKTVRWRQGSFLAADATFIAHARTDIPALLRDLRDLRLQRDAARAALKRYGGHDGECDCGYRDGDPENDCRRVYYGKNEPCTCGYALAAIRALSASLDAEEGK